MAALVDVKCWDLAAHFLQDGPSYTEAHRMELARVIQQAIEDHLPDLEKRIAEKQP